MFVLYFAISELHLQPIEEELGLTNLGTPPRIDSRPMVDPDQ